MQLPVGSESAFADLVERYQDRVFRLPSRYTRDGLAGLVTGLHHPDFEVIGITSATLGGGYGSC